MGYGMNRKNLVENQHSLMYYNLPPKRSSNGDDSRCINNRKKTNHNYIRSKWNAE